MILFQFTSHISRYIAIHCDLKLFMLYEASLPCSQSCKKYIIGLDKNQAETTHQNHAEMTQNQNSLLVKRQTDNTTPRGWVLSTPDRTKSKIGIQWFFNPL